MVKLDANYYHVDVTFDDPVMEGSEQSFSYEYFNLNDKEISKTHAYVKEDYPSCNSDEYNFYVYKNLVAKNKRDFYNIIESGVLSRKETITLKTAEYDSEKFNPNVVYDVFDNNPKIKCSDSEDGVQYCYNNKNCIMDIYLKYK
ncbi:MAG: hypothetical protein ABRQ25_13510 [Clostridiaceae bacterium]